MGIFSTPSIQTPPAPPTVQDVSTDEDIAARSDARKRQMAAVNSRTSILSDPFSQASAGGGFNRSGSKTLLGE